MTLQGTYIPKQTMPKRCKNCGVTVYYVWSTVKGQRECRPYDVESEGNKRPTSRVAGFGNPHCQNCKALKTA